MIKKLKIYVGCAIQGLTPTEWDEIKEKRDALKAELSKRGHEILDFKSNAQRQAPPGTVFRHDYEQCLACDAMIAIVLRPSTGLGMEVMSCLLKPEPAFVFATAPQGNNTTRMITDCDLPGFVYKEFEVWERVTDEFERAYLQHIASFETQLGVG